MDAKYGQLKIQLSELMAERGLNKYKLSHMAEMSWTQLSNYCNNNITRLDTFVLCKLCTVLDCKIEDLLLFIPAENEKH